MSSNTENKLGPRAITYPHEIDRSEYDWPTFSPQEFERRHSLVRGFMDAHDLDCLLIAGNSAIWERGWAKIRWVTNFMGTMELDTFCIFPREGEITLAILGLNARLPDRLARSVVTDIRGSLNTSTVLVDRLKELGVKRSRIGIVNPAPYISIHADHWNALHDSFPESDFLCFSDEFWRMRLVHSDEEVACLEEAGRIGDAAVQALIDELRPGMTEQDMFQIIYSTFAAEGGEIPCMVLAASESMDQPKSAFQRPRAINRQISKGDILLLELGARDPHGYEAQTGKPITFGPPNAHYQEMLDVCFDAYEAIVDVLKPGCCARDIREAGQVIIDRGYTVVAPLVLGVFNPLDAGPFVGTSHRPDKDVILEPNMACCVEIHPCSEDIRAGVFMGDTYLITDTGARSLNKLPPRIYEVE